MARRQSRCFAITRNTHIVCNNLEVVQHKCAASSGRVSQSDNQLLLRRSCSTSNVMYTLIRNGANPVTSLSNIWNTFPARYYQSYRQKCLCHWKEQLALSWRTIFVYYKIKNSFIRHTNLIYISSALYKVPNNCPYFTCTNPKCHPHSP